MRTSPVQIRILFCVLIVAIFPFDADLRVARAHEHLEPEIRPDIQGDRDQERREREEREREEREQQRRLDRYNEDIRIFKELKTVCDDQAGRCETLAEIIDILEDIPEIGPINNKEAAKKAMKYMCKINGAGCRLMIDAARPYIEDRREYIDMMERTERWRNMPIEEMDQNQYETYEREVLGSTS